MCSLLGFRPFARSLARSFPLLSPSLALVPTAYLAHPRHTHTHTHTHSFSHSLFSGSLVCSVNVPFALLRAPSPSRSRCLPRSPHHSQTLAHLPFPSPLPSSSLLSVLLLCCCLSRPLHHHPTLSLTLTPFPACSTFLDPSHSSFSFSLPLLGSSLIPCSLVPSLSCV